MSSTRKAAEGTTDISIVGDKVSIHPLGYKASPISNHETHDRNLVEHMARFRESPLDFLKEISLYVSGSGWRSYDDIIGQPIFYNGFSEDMIAAVMASPMLQQKINDLAQRRVELEEVEGLFGEGGASDVQTKEARRKEIEGQLKEVAEKLTDDMICKMESKRFIRGAYYLATALLTRAYHQGIHVSSEEVLRLRSVAEKAARDKHAIIFLPCHRSHVDYVSLQLICYRLGLALPTVVAGDNLNFPLVGYFLQHAGAMWIRRSFGEDQLYVTLVQAYIDTLLQKGLNFECFIEGGRSRMGKLLPPKFGILSFLLDSVLSGRVDDAMICPVSTQYDKVIEVDSYVSELLGTPKQKENLKDFLSSGSSVLSLKLGRVDCRFHEPWSLRGFISAQQTRLALLPAQQTAALNKAYGSNLRIRLLRTLGYKVLSDINAVSVVMPTSLIGTVLLTLRGRAGVGKVELVRRVEWLSDRVRDQGGRVAHFAGLPTEVVVGRALEVLGPKLVGVRKDLAEETYFAVDRYVPHTFEYCVINIFLNRFQLSFYRNMTIHLFVNQALVSASIYTWLRNSDKDGLSQSISYDDLHSHVSFLSQLFRGEFIYATAGLTVNLAHTLTGLEADGVIDITRKELLSEKRSQPVQNAEESTPSAMQDNKDTDTTISTISLSTTERRSGRQNFDFYCFLIWPFVEASWLGAVSLLMLTPPFRNTTTTRWHAPTKLHDLAQILGKTLHAQGLLTYLEAVNKEVLKNVFARLEEDGILVASAGMRKSGKALRLADQWTPERDTTTGNIKTQGSRLWEFCESIARSRVEDGVDGGGGEERVLRLVETVGRGFWEEKNGTTEAAHPKPAELKTWGRDAGIIGLKVVKQEQHIQKRRSWGSLAGLADLVKARM